MCAYMDVMHSIRGLSEHGNTHLLNRVEKETCRGKVVLPSALVQVKTKVEKWRT